MANAHNVQRTPIGVVALVLPFLGLGWIGVHKFMLGYTKEGLTSIAISLLTCGIGGFILSVISIVEGIIYLSKSDQDFYVDYVVRHKGWF